MYQIFKKENLHNAFKKINLPDIYIKRILEAVNLDNSIQAFRPNHPNTKKLLGTPSFATKNIFCKGKSDPETGMIDPYQARSKTFKKLEKATTDKNKAEVKKLTKELLTNTESIKQMIQKKVVTIVKKKDKNNKTQEYLANQRGEVFLADADPLFNAYKNTDKKIQFHPDRGWLTQSDLKSLVRNIFYQTSETKKSGKTQFVRNTAMHHGPESFFGKAQKIDFSEGPIWIALPGSKIIIADNESDLVSAIADIQASGYTIPLNPAWELNDKIENIQDAIPLPIEYKENIQKDKFDPEIQRVVNYLWAESELEHITDPIQKTMQHAILTVYAKIIVENPLTQNFCEKALIHPKAYNILKKRANGEHIGMRGLKSIFKIKPPQLKKDIQFKMPKRETIYATEGFENA